MDAAEVIKILIGALFLLIGIVELSKAITALQTKGVGLGANITLLSSSVLLTLAGMYLIIDSL